MATLLVLGAKPDPALPDPSTYQEVACANGSGFSAAKHGLPTPTFTVMTANLTSGAESGRESIQAISGLRTTTVYYVPRPHADRRKRSLISRLKYRRRLPRMTAEALQRALAAVGFEYAEFVVQDHSFYIDLARSLCQQDAEMTALLGAKQPSMGIYALILGITSGRYDRFILSGYSFELTHPYGDNRKIRNRGTAVSRHTPTDVALVSLLSRTRGDLVTTEAVVHERTGVPLL